jgi:hypothetical protein
MVPGLLVGVIVLAILTPVVFLVGGELPAWAVWSITLPVVLAGCAWIELRQARRRQAEDERRSGP